jgi:hypothetical protein
MCPHQTVAVFGSIGTCGLPVIVSTTPTTATTVDDGGHQADRAPTFQSARVMAETKYVTALATEQEYRDPADSVLEDWLLISHVMIVWSLLYAVELHG